MKFIFSLATLLKAKHLKEKKIQKDLSEILISLQKTELKKSEVENEIDESRQDYFNLYSKGKIDAGELTIYQNYFTQKGDELKKIVAEIKKLKNQEVMTRNSLIDMTKERKSLEKLKEKEYSKFLNEVREKENKELDEISIRNFSNNQSA